MVSVSKGRLDDSPVVLIHEHVVEPGQRSHDESVVHSTRTSSLDQVFNWTKELIVVENEVLSSRSTNTMVRDLETSPVVVEVCKAKVDRDDRML